MATTITTLTTLLLLFVTLCNWHCALGSPMLYKRNEQEKYEADLVPVSSTVIPLTVLEVSYGAGGKPSEEYKAAYLRKLRKKVQLKNAAKSSDAHVAGMASVSSANGSGDDDDIGAGAGASSGGGVTSAKQYQDADVLITVKSKQTEANRAKVKGIE